MRANYNAATLRALQYQNEYSVAKCAHSESIRLDFVRAQSWSALVQYQNEYFYITPELLQLLL